MTPTITRYAFLAAVFICSALLPAKLNATLTMTLSGTAASSIVTASFSGSSLAQSTGGAFLGLGWEFDPAAFNPFPQEITGSDFGGFLFTSGAATMTIDGFSQNMTGVFLQDSSNSPLPGSERFGATGFQYNLTAGQNFEWSGSATFDLSAKGLTFDDLNPGSTGPVNSFFGAPAAELVVTAASNSVPDSGTTALFLCVAFSGLSLIRRKLT